MASVNTLGPVVINVTCSTVAAQVSAASVSAPVEAFSLYNISSSTVYLGGATVSTLCVPITAGSSILFDKHLWRNEKQPFGLDNYYLVTTTLGTAATTTVVALYHTIATRH